MFKFIVILFGLVAVVTAVGTWMGWIVQPEPASRVAYVVPRVLVAMGLVLILLWIWN